VALLAGRGRGQLRRAEGRGRSDRWIRGCARDPSTATSGCGSTACCRPGSTRCSPTPSSSIPISAPGREPRAVGARKPHRWAFSPFWPGPFAWERRAAAASPGGRAVSGRRLGPQLAAAGATLVVAAFLTYAALVCAPGRSAGRIRLGRPACDARSDPACRARSTNWGWTARFPCAFARWLGCGSHGRSRGLVPHPAPVGREIVERPRTDARAERRGGRADRRDRPAARWWAARRAAARGTRWGSAALLAALRAADALVALLLQHLLSVRLGSPAALWADRPRGRRRSRDAARASRAAGRDAGPAPDRVRRALCARHRAHGVSSRATPSGRAAPGSPSAGSSRVTACGRRWCRSPPLRG